LKAHTTRRPTSFPSKSNRHCDESAQNTCPGWADMDAVLQGWVQAMWGEGPGDVPEEHGHYMDMSSTQYSRVACGFYQMPHGEIWASQDSQ
jgi:hypothetical protein